MKEFSGELAEPSNTLPTWGNIDPFTKSSYEGEKKIQRCNSKIEKEEDSGDWRERRMQALEEKLMVINQTKLMEASKGHLVLLDQ